MYGVTNYRATPRVIPGSVGRRGSRQPDGTGLLPLFRGTYVCYLGRVCFLYQVTKIITEVPCLVLVTKFMYIALITGYKCIVTVLSLFNALMLLHGYQSLQLSARTVKGRQ